MENNAAQAYPNGMRFDLAPAELSQAADRFIAESKARLDDLVASVDELIKKHNKLPIPFNETPMQARSDEAYHLSVGMSICTFPRQARTNHIQSNYFDFPRPFYMHTS